MSKVTYAESLGVHSIHEEAVAALDAYKALQVKRVAALRTLRDARGLIEDEEHTIVASTPLQESAAAWERALKVARSTSEVLDELRHREQQAQIELDGIDAGLSVYDHTLKVAVARMNALGGLLSFYSDNQSSQSNKE